MLSRLRRWLTRRRDRDSLAEDDALRRQSERELREAERRMAEERQRLESRSPGPW